MWFTRKLLEKNLKVNNLESSCINSAPLSPDKYIRIPVISNQAVI